MKRTAGCRLAVVQVVAVGWNSYLTWKANKMWALITGPVWAVTEDFTLTCESNRQSDSQRSRTNSHYSQIKAWFMEVASHSNSPVSKTLVLTGFLVSSSTFFSAGCSVSATCFWKINIAVVETDVKVLTFVRCFEFDHLSISEPFRSDVTDPPLVVDVGTTDMSHILLMVNNRIIYVKFVMSFVFCKGSQSQHPNKCVNFL